MSIRRIILHWTGGGPKPNATDLESYHALVDQQANRYMGNLAPEANINISDGIYARHAGGFNTGSLGLSLCGMLDAIEKPFDAGRWPIKSNQFNEACLWTAELLISYRLKVSKATCMLHSEVRPRYGAGIYKWDVNWLPGMTKPSDPFIMGDAYRKRVASEYETLMNKGSRPSSVSSWFRRHLS